MRLSVGTFRRGYSTFKNSRLLRFLHKTRYVTAPAIVITVVAGLAMLVNLSPIGRYVFKAVTDSSTQGNSSVLFVIFSNFFLYRWCIAGYCVGFIRIYGLSATS